MTHCNISGPDKGTHAAGELILRFELDADIVFIIQAVHKVRVQCKLFGAM